MVEVKYLLMVRFAVCVGCNVCGGKVRDFVSFMTKNG